MAVSFTTVLHQGNGNTVGIIVPEDVMAQLGPGKRYPVVVTIGDYSFRNSVSWYRGAFMIGVNSQVRAESGVSGGDEVQVTLDHDTAPRILELPAEVEAALQEAGALDRFRALSHSKQRGLVEPWIAAKSDATRVKNLVKILDASA
jgi:hypothetical protein